METLLFNLFQMLESYAGMVITIEITSYSGYDLFKGNIFNVPYHLARSEISSWCIENYNVKVRLNPQ